MKKNRIIQSVFAVAAFGACIVQPVARENSGVPGGSAPVLAPGANGAPAPAAPGAPGASISAPKAVINAPSEVVTTRVFYVDGSASNSGGAPNLTYAWTAAGGYTITPSTASQPVAEVTAPVAGNPSASITLTVSNGSTNSVTVVVPVVAGTEVRADGGGGGAATPGAAGGVIQVRGRGTVSNGTYALPAVPPAGSRVLIVTDKWGVNNGIDNDDVCKEAQKFAVGAAFDTAPCNVSEIPRIYDTIQLGNPANTTTAPFFEVDLATLNAGTAAGDVRFEEIRVAGQLSTQTGKIELSGKRIVVDGILNTNSALGNGDVTLSADEVLLVNKPLRTDSGDVTLTLSANAVAPLYVVDEIDTQDNGGTGGPVVITQSSTKHPIVIWGNVTTSGATNTPAGAITITAEAPIHFPRLNVFRAPGGNATTDNALSDGGPSGRIVIVARGTGVNNDRNNAHVSFVGVEFNADAGSANSGTTLGSGGNGVNGGTDAEASYSVYILAGDNSGDVREASVVVGRLGSNGNLIHSNGGEGIEGGNGGRVGIFAWPRAGGDAQIVGVGGNVSVAGGRARDAGGAAADNIGGDGGFLNVEPRYPGDNTARARAAIRWIGNLNADAGDSLLPTSGLAAVYAPPGAAGTVQVQANSTVSSEIFIDGNIEARPGLGEDSNAACAYTDVEKVFINANAGLAAGSEASVFVKRIDLTQVTPPASSTASSGLVGSAAGGNVYARAWAHTSANVKINELIAKGTSADAGGRGCFVHVGIEPDNGANSVALDSTLDISKLEIQGGNGVKNGNAGAGGDAIVAFNRSNKATLILPAGLTANGGTQSGSGTDAGNGGAGGNLRIVRDLDGPGTTAAEHFYIADLDGITANPALADVVADYINVRIGADLTTAGGSAAARGTPVSGGLGGTTSVLLGSPAVTQQLDVDMKNIITTGGSATSSGTFPASSQTGGAIVLSMQSKLDSGAGSGKIGNLQSFGGTPAAASAANGCPTTGNGATIDVTQKVNGVFTFGAFDARGASRPALGAANCMLAGGNGQPVTFATGNGQRSTTTIASVNTNGGASYTGGTGANATFTVPTAANGMGGVGVALTVTGAIDVSGGAPNTGTLGGAGQVKHTGPPVKDLVSITCGSANITGTGTSGCIDVNFTCGAALPQCAVPPNNP